MILARNSTDIYEIMFAAWRLGAVFMPVNWRLAPRELAEIVGDAEPALCIADEGFAEHLPPGQRLLSRKPGDITSEYERAITTSVADARFAAASAPLTLDTMNTLLYTSGTTGKAKGVIGTWRMTTAMLLQAGSSAHLTPDSVTLTAAPQFHTAGLNGFATPLFHLGGTLVVMAAWDAESFLRHLSDPALGITHTLAVPAQYAAAARHPSFTTATFSTVQIAAVGGAPPSRELLETYAARGLPLTPGYGMTEVFGVTEARAEIALRKPNSLGFPALHVDLRVADSEGGQTVLPPHAIGEIQVRSAGVTPGYWKQDDLTAAAFVEGWFRTGDLGYFDDEGLLFLVDRKKDMFISGGENVYPSEIENVISAFPEVAQVAVIGVADSKWGEVGLAAVVLRPGQVLSSESLTSRCRGQIAAYKIPKRVIFTDALPTSAQGKILKTALRNLYAG